MISQRLSLRLPIISNRLVINQSIPINNRLLSTSSIHDIAIIGGGIVGCATAMQLQQKYKHLDMVLLEKESKLAQHQSGRNSGVLHAGLYYAPGSLRAELCVRGIDLLYEYCDKHNVPYKKCGKLIVATDEVEVKRLETIFERATQNKCRDIRMIDGKDIKSIEPHCEGLKAIHSPHTGIIDYGKVTDSFGQQFSVAGGKILCDRTVTNLQSIDNDRVLIECKGQQPIEARKVIVCGGLHADRLAALSGAEPTPKIVPFRGEYLLLRPEKQYLVKGNIYPVPDPNFPFLGVHFTPRMNGDVWMGPNAVLAYSREGYSYLHWNARDLMESVTYSGLHRLAFKYFSFGVSELARSFLTSLQVNKLRKMVPELTRHDAITGPTGVRAQALAADGELVEDFIFDSPPGVLSDKMLHVRNAPSPAATSSLAIAERIVQKSEKLFQLN